VAENRLISTVAGAIAGLQVRGDEITVESVWDDVDIVHVLQNEIIVQNFHTATGVRLVSRSDASLVVKHAGTNAGFTAAGYGLDINDRIGGTVQILGQPGYAVVLTSLNDDSVGASLDPLGRPMNDTNSNGASVGAAGDWRSLKFLPMSNDRNVSIQQERELPLTGGIDINGAPASAQPLGVLAPNFATGANTTESAQEKSGDDNRRLGFEVAEQRPDRQGRKRQWRLCVALHQRHRRRSAEPRAGPWERQRLWICWTAAAPRQTTPSAKRISRGGECWSARSPPSRHRHRGYQTR
jgi:hypothetical protein